MCVFFVSGSSRIQTHVLLIRKRTPYPLPYLDPLNDHDHMLSRSGTAGDKDILATPAVSPLGLTNLQNWPPRPVWQPRQAEQLMKRLDIKALLSKVEGNIFWSFESFFCTTNLKEHAL